MTDHLRDRIAAAIWERQNPGRSWTDCEYRWRADTEEDADAVLAALLAVGPDREQRIRLDDLTSDQLDGLYDDLDRYTEVVGEMNDNAIRAAKENADTARKLRESQWRHEDAERRVRIQRERADHAERESSLLAHTIAATSKQTVAQVLEDVHAALDSTETTT